jgi:hypothetical protein
MYSNSVKRRTGNEGALWVLSSTSSVVRAIMSIVRA